ncbi:MAG: hypothetical protein AAGH53_11670 [Pseudomonadota bacterium]
MLLAMPSKDNEDDRESGFEEHFLRTLLEDAINAINRCSNEDNAANYRDAIRTIFASLEGVLAWWRESILDFAQHSDSLDLKTILALSEISFSIDSDGNVNERKNHIPFVTMVKLCGKALRRINPDWKLDLSVKGWAQVKRATDIRNRIMHPKNASHLIVSMDELNDSVGGLLWFLETTVGAVENTNRSLRENYAEIRMMLKAAKAETIYEPKA